jgi:hypothetical protein
MSIPAKRFVALIGVVALAASCSSGDDESRSGQRAPIEDTAGEPASFPATPLPEARTEVSGALWNRHLAVAGGFTEDGRPSERLDLLDEDGEWIRGPDLPSQRDHASLAVLDDRLYLVGGIKTDDGGSRPTDEVWSVGPGDRRWRREPSLGTPRAALATVGTDGVLVAIGGYDGTDAVASTEILDPAIGDWRPGPRLNVPREHTAAAAVGDSVYAIGGRQLSLESNLDSVEYLALPDGAWQTFPDLEHTRGGIGAAAVGDSPCVAGGEEPGGTIETVECVVDGSWESVATLEVPRHGLAMVAAGERLHVLGGGPQPGLFVSTAHEIIDVPR